MQMEQQERTNEWELKKGFFDNLITSGWDTTFSFTD